MQRELDEIEITRATRGSWFKTLTELLKERDVRVYIPARNVKWNASFLEDLNRWRFKGEMRGLWIVVEAA